MLTEVRFKEGRTGLEEMETVSLYSQLIDYKGEEKCSNRAGGDMTFKNVLKWERFFYRRGQIITRECQKIYFREEGRFLWCLFKGPRLHTTTIPFESTRGELWAV